MRNLEKAEIRALLTVAKAKRERDWLMILLAYNHGLRVSELLKIQPDDIHQGMLYTDRLKGSEDTTHPLVEHSDPLFSERQALVDLARETCPKTPLFNITRQRFWQLMKEYGKKAGIARKRLFPHALRHATGHELVDKIGVPKTQRYMGHKSGASTLVYTKPPEAEATAAALRVLQS